MRLLHFTSSLNWQLDCGYTIKILKSLNVNTYNCDSRSPHSNCPCNSLAVDKVRCTSISTRIINCLARSIPFEIAYQRQRHFGICQ
jgi:hypothetical protein